jgi:hypothetical protein
LGVAVRSVGLYKFDEIPSKDFNVFHGYGVVKGKPLVTVTIKYSGTTNEPRDLSVHLFDGHNELGKDGLNHYADGLLHQLQLC